MSSAKPDSYRYMDAIRDAMADEMRADASVCLLGIDVGRGGGIFGVTRGLYDEFGPRRVLDAPISEGGFLGAAVGAAAAGLRPVVEIMFMDFFGLCFDAILNQASKLPYMSGGGLRIPLVIRTQTGVGRSSGAQHSQHLEAIVAHIPGLKVVLPGTVADAYVLLRAAIRDPNPVVYVENRRLYSAKGDRPFGEPISSIGGARIAREGGGVTVVAWSRTVAKAVAAGELLAESGISAEVIDVRSLVPLDVETLVRSVKKTGHGIIVHDAVVDYGAGAEIAARMTEQAFAELQAPIMRIGCPAVPVPYSPPLEQACVPDEKSIVDGVKKLLGGR